jgi:hypothetical protein
MSVDTLHVLAGILTPSQYFTQIEDYSVSPNISEMLKRPGGMPYPMFRGVRGLKPEVTFRTSQLASLITACGATCADLGTSGNTDLQFRKAVNRGVRELDASVVHTRMRIAKGWMFWNSMTFPHQGEASADVRLVAQYDGTNVPIVSVGSVAITGTPTAAEAFSLGPVAINTTVIDGIQSLTLSNGWTTKQVGANSEGYDTFGALWQMDPVVSITGLSVEEWASYGFGTALTALTFYGRALMSDTAGSLPYIAVGTAAHIKVVATVGQISLEQARGGEDGEVQTTLKLRLRTATAAVAPYTIACNTAIT